MEKTQVDLSDYKMVQLFTCQSGTKEAEDAYYNQS